MQWGAVLVWWVAWTALFLAGLPIAATIFKSTPTRGAFVALPLALVVVTLPILWVGQVIYGPITAAIGVLILLGISITTFRQNVDIDRRAAMEILGVFTVAFLFLLAIRSIDAGAVNGGGEKFLDFGLVQSLLRAEYLPPADHWWAGGRVIYYYGGHLQTATLAILTDTPGRLAYNLALAGFYAIGVSSVYGFAAAIAANRGLSRQTAGGLGAFLFGFASNLYTTAGAIATYLYPPAIEQLATATDHAEWAVRVTIETFSYWFASRVIPGVITEFPLFAYLNGDLHAHMTDTGLLLLVAGIGYAYYHTPGEHLTHRRLLIFGVLPSVIAVVTLVNTWSLPATLGLTWLALSYAPASPTSLLTPRYRGPSESPLDRTVLEGRRISAAMLLTVPVAMLSLLLVSPFVWNVLLVGATDRSIGVVTDRTGLVAFLIAHGGFIAIFTWYVFGYAPRTDSTRLGIVAVAWAAVAVFALAVDFPALAIVGPLLAVVWYLHRHGLDSDRSARTRPGYEAVLLVAGAGLVLIVEVLYLRDAASPGRFNTVFKTYAQVWPLWSVAGGVSLMAAIDRPLRSEVEDWLPGRFTRHIIVAVLLASLSTYGVLALFEHFHEYVVVWFDHLSLIIGGAAVLGLLTLVVIDTISFPGTYPGRGLTEFAWDHPVIIGVVTFILVFHAGIAVTADAADTPGAEPTLDAIAYVHTWHSGEAPAIEWLLDRPAQPYIVSAPGWNVYGWASEAASLTGLPTVAGWATEGIYRGGDAYADRASDVDLLFRGSPEIRAALLRKYDVTYIYVGPNERQRYSDADLQFADEPGISVAYTAPAVTIYAVNQSGLKTI